MMASCQTVQTAGNVATDKFWIVCFSGHPGVLVWEILLIRQLFEQAKNVISEEEW